MADTQIAFKEFCDLCEKIQSARIFSDKESLLLNFIKKYKKLEATIQQTNPQYEQNFYPALRLLVPKYERERGPYGLQETSFSRLYIRTLCLQGSDANNLSSYNKIQTGTKNTNDFADVAYWVLRKYCPTTSKLTIADVNKHLDTMANKHAEHLPREVENELKTMIKTSTAVEQKWIIRIILKDMKLGLGNDRILKIFHQDAPDLYDISNSLIKICKVLKDPSIRLHELELEIFTPFRPMLSQQCNATVLNQTVKGNQIFYVENKYDGERFQMHMKDGVFKYFSKNGYEYSNVFGENYNSQGLITPHLKHIFENVRNVILDGEMMGWNKKTNAFGSKGMSYDVKNLKPNSVHRPCYCVFDILLYNDKILTNVPLRDRLEILDNLFDPLEGVLIQSPRTEVRTTQELLHELNKSVDKQEEGICFKDPNSIYKPNNRKAGWWKMKLEYFGGLLTELDVIIIGGYYGDGKRQGQINSFLLGVAVSSNNPDESPSEFHSFAKVASGFSAEELNKLLDMLNPHWKVVSKNVANPDGILWKKEKPDVWIDPKKSCILQVKASELTKTSEFQAEYTLRFPRVEKVRYDKPWYDCLTTTELKELTKNNKAVEKLSSRHLTTDDIEESPPKRQRKAKQPSIQLYHLVDVKPKSKLFDNLEFCVFTGTAELTKENIEVKIKENGGKVVQFEGPNTYCTLVGDITPRVSVLISTSSRDIVKLDWFIRALKNPTKLLRLTPDDMISTSSATKIEFSDKFDKYGDSYTKPVTKKSLQKILDNVSAQGDYFNLMQSDFVEFEEILSFKNPLGIFRLNFAYFDKYRTVNDPRSEKTVLLQNVEYDFRFFGGVICDKIDKHTTHVIVHTSDISRVGDLKRTLREVKNELTFIVSEKWIEESILARKILAEDTFILNN